MGKVKNDWQDRDYVLKWFGTKEGEAKLNEDSPPQAAEYLISNDFFIYVASDGVLNPCYAIN